MSASLPVGAGLGLAPLTSGGGAAAVASRATRLPFAPAGVYKCTYDGGVDMGNHAVATLSDDRQVSGFLVKVVDVDAFKRALEGSGAATGSGGAIRINPMRSEDETLLNNYVNVLIVGNEYIVVDDLKLSVVGGSETKTVKSFEQLESQVTALMATSPGDSAAILVGEVRP